MVPEIELTLPRPVTAVHAIATSERCNLRCVYCPHPKLGRPKQDMSREVFERALVHVNYHVNMDLTQDEVQLSGIGEPLLNPNIVDFVRLTRELVGDKVFVTFPTNGLLFDEDMAKALAPYMSKHHGVKPGLFVSLHRPEKAGPAVNLAKKYGMLAGVSTDPALASVDWAGQVDWPVTAPPDRACPWIRLGRVIVLADGQIASCCMPADYTGVIGSVWNEPGTLLTQPHEMCSKCDQIIAIKGYQQGRKLPTL